MNSVVRRARFESPVAGAGLAGNCRRTVEADLLHQEMKLHRQCSAILEIRIADTFLSRLRGLLGEPPLVHGQGLLMTRCSSVHAIGLSCAIDVVFLDGQGQVLRCQSLQPWGMAICRNAELVLELPKGSACVLGVAQGSRLCGVDSAAPFS